jgi:hypothetical protein
MEVAMDGLKYLVDLNSQTRQHLEQIVRNGSWPAKKIMHARVLLLSDEHHPAGRYHDHQIAQILGLHINTIAKIRSTTKNTLVRALADQANVTVLDHITVMEKTGLVNFDTVLFQETTPPKLPASDVTPPVPAPGSPTVVLTPPPAVGGYPAPSPTAG